MTPTKPIKTIRFNIPTILTVARVILIPFFFIITPENPLLGVVIFLLAGLTDFLDGYLARKFGQITKFGMIADPIADKFLVISALILLVDMVKLSAWIAVLIIVREFWVTALRVVALSKDIVMPAEFAGKLKTALQMIAIVLLLLPGSLFGFDLYDAGLILIYISTILALTSAFNYTYSFWRQLQ